MKARVFASFVGFAAGSILAILTGPAVAQDAPQYGGVVNYVEASGHVTINGIPVADFTAEEGGSGGTTMFLSDWMVNGANELVLTIKTATERGRAELEVQEFADDGPAQSLELSGPGTATLTVPGEGLPEWAWLNATPQASPAGLADQVAAFHEAFATANLERIIEMAKPFLADQAIAGGLTEEIFREELGPILADGKMLDLPELTIVAHQDGRLYRVTGPDGEPPVNLEFEIDGMSSAVRSGEWWSTIDGEWLVVR